MSRTINDPLWKRAARAAMRAAGSPLPDSLRLRLLHHRPALNWLIPPGRTIRIKHYLNDLTIEVHTDSKIERQMLSGTYEPHLQRVLRRFVPSGATCLDIGANVGAMTLSLAKLAGPTGCVHALEPAPMIHERLQRNIALNPSLHSRITTHNIGLGREQSTLHWLQSSAGQGNGRLLDHPAAGSVAVPVTTLDQFVTAHVQSSIDFIKMDVERMELDVVFGGVDTLRAHQPIILFETLPCHGITELQQCTHTLLNTLRDLGYQLHNVHRRRLTPIPPGDLPSAYESLALPGEIKPSHNP